MRRIRYLVVFCLFLLLSACSSRQVPLDQQFHIQKDERVAISGEPLSITLDGVGREWDEEGEYLNASLVVHMNGEEQKILLYLGETWELDGYVIEMVSANPFGDPTSCELVVMKDSS